MEYDNPAVLIVRAGRIIRPARERLPWQGPIPTKRTRSWSAPCKRNWRPDHPLFRRHHPIGDGHPLAPPGLGRGEPGALRPGYYHGRPEISSRELATRITGRARATIWARRGTTPPAVLSTFASRGSSCW
jgi:hypothetical protein